MDWTTSGRTDEFIFEKIPPNALSKSRGTIKGVVGGKLTFDYSSELKISGTLDVVDTDFVNGDLIRIFYRPTLNGKTEKIRLCTCFAETSEMNYDNGSWSGTINLRSVLARHIDDQIPKNFVCKSKSSAKARFKAMFDWLQGSAVIRSNVRDKKYDKAVVYEMGKSPMEVLQGIAKFLDSEITCDTYGRTVLQKKIKAKNRTVAYDLPSESISVILPGVTFQDSVAGTTNRVVCTYSYKKNGKTKKLRAVAKAASTSRVSKAKQGRWITKTYKLNSLYPKTQARINKVAKNKLTNDSAVTKYWKITCFYLPLPWRCLRGQVVRFRYGKLTIRGQLTSIDMDLSAGGMLDVTIKEVGRSGSLQ